MTNLLEPWVALRLLAGATSTALFARAAWTALKIVRRFDVRRATEGQLALERQAELASTLVRFATALQIAGLVLTVLVADRLSLGMKGAMCAFGVFDASPAGWTALATSGAAALAAAVLSELHALDARSRGLTLVRPLAVATLAMAPLAAADLAATSALFLGLDLTAVASCCSLDVDAGGAARGSFGAPRAAVVIVAAVATTAAIAAALIAARGRPRPTRAIPSGVLAVVAAPLAAVAITLGVAPHVYETPHHTCPFCLFHEAALGYPLFGAVFLALVSGISAPASLLLSRAESEPAVAFARGRLRRQALSWIVALLLAVTPIARYAWISGGATLFH